MKATKFKIIVSCIIILIVSVKGFSQDDFWSRIFFPNTYGINFPINNSVMNKGSIISNGLEYRFGVSKPLFIRFSLDNYSTIYTIQSNNETNAIESDLKMTGYYFGSGYRSEKKPLRFIALLQTGFTIYKYPSVKNINQDYKVSFNTKKSFTTRITLGIEYYINYNFALIAEIYHIYMPNESIFWNNNFQSMGIKFGITTTLF
jgi:hypothetical protein